MEYKDISIFPLVANLGDTVRRRLQYEPEEHRYGFGVHPATGTQTHTRERVEVISIAENADTLDAVESFLQSRKGRFQGFWMPTMSEDVTAIAVGATATVLIYSDTFSDWSHLAGKHLAFLSPDGEWHYREVLSVAGSNSDQSILTLDAALPAITDVWRVSRLLFVRLTGDDVDFDFEADNHARIRFAVTELPLEYAQPNTLATRRPVYFYRITRRYGVRNIYSMHLTSHDQPVQSGAFTWHPVPIDHGGLSVSTEGDTDKLNIELFAWEGNPFEDWLPIHIGQPTGIVLSQSHVDEATGLVLEAPTILFRGIVESVTRQGHALKAKAISPLAYGDKRVPRFYLQTRCNYQLFDGSTCRLAANNFRADGQVLAIDTEVGSIDFESTGLSGKSADWLAGGYLEIGTPPHVEVRTIRDAQVLSDTVHRLFLNASLRTSAVADSCSAWPGCNRTPDHCKNRFDNFINYGGHPFIPYENPTLKAMPLVTPAASGGKK